MKLAQLCETEAARLELVKDKRRRVDALRLTHERLQRELEALDHSAGQWRSGAAVEAMRAELARCTAELRAASRDLIKSI
jgi:two-component sensor histidine kinase